MMKPSQTGAGTLSGTVYGTVSGALSGTLFDSPLFEPSRAAALARLAAVRPAAYARTRNHIEGDVTRLSPYLTHGLISMREVLAGVLQRSPAAAAMPVDHKFVYELAWREYFHHVWLHRGRGILDSLHEGVLPESEYARELPADIRTAQTSIPAIDTAVRELYACGYLHNHSRMWLASYVVHLRKVHWRAGADWMFGHLLDGDLASNHLSWQWVAGTGSSKPYLFNADNVARYAPAHWHSAGSTIDTNYEALDALARSPRALPGGPARGGGVAEPELLHRAPATGQPPDPAQVIGRHVLLLHPWCMHATPHRQMRLRMQELGTPLSADTLRIGLIVDECHTEFAWNARRWRFVGDALKSSCDVVWQGSAIDLKRALAGAASVQVQADPHAGDVLAEWPAHPAPTLFAWPEQSCASFSKFWSRCTRGLTLACELIEGDSHSM